MVDAIHVGAASAGACAGILGYFRTLARDRLPRGPVRLPWAATMGAGLLLSRLTFGLERGLPLEETLRPAPGGYVLYGALPALWLVPVWLRARGLQAEPYLDRAAPWILLALAPARVGCWLAGCCAGLPLDRGIPPFLLPGEALPAPLLAAAGNVLAGAALLFRVHRGRSPGTASLGLILHGLLRTLLDPLRARSVTHGGLGLLLVLWGVLRLWRGPAPGRSIPLRLRN